MRRTRVTALAALVVAFASCGTSAAQRHLATHIGDAAQDGYGFVWAASREGKLFVCEGSSWHNVELPPLLNGATFLAMTPDPSGHVQMLWRSEAGAVILTESKGAAPTPRATLHGVAGTPTIFCDSAGDVWIATPEHIYQVAAGQQEAKRVYTIPPELYDRVFAASDPVNPLRAVEVEQGRIWFWSESRFRGGETALRRVVIRDGGKWEVALLDQLPSHRFAAIAQRDPQHLLVAVHYEGLFTVNTTTRAVRRVEEPEPDAFRNVRGVHKAGERTLLVAEQNIEGREETVLWQERNGRFTKLATRLDPALTEASDRDRAVLQLPDEQVLLGSFGGGMWLLRDDEAVQLDWRARVRLATINRLLPLKREQFVGIDFERGDTFIGRNKPLPTPHPQPRGATYSGPPPIQDARKHLWTVSRDWRSLAEWNGSAWTLHPKPNSLPQLHPQLGVDSDNRVWMMQPPIAIFDPATKEWEVFPDFRAAMEAQVGSGRRFPGFTLRPFLSGDERVVFSDPFNGEVHYFDGRAWQEWRNAGGCPVKEAAVFFADDGALTCKSERGVWQFVEGEGWKERPAAVVRAPEGASHARPFIPSPPEVGALRPESHTWDESGICWFTQGRGLHKHAFGKTVAVFAPNEVHPFLDGRRLDYRQPVRMDAGGNTVVYAGEIVVFPPRTAAPETNARLLQVKEGRAEVDLSGSSPKASMWRWRINNGGWSKPAAEKLLSVDLEQNGTYVLEVAAIDDELQVDQTPARVEVSVQVDWQALLAPAVEALRAGDEPAREAAIETLARQPELALPALQKAREKATDEQRWWIDAATQELQRRAQQPR